MDVIVGYFVSPRDSWGWVLMLFVAEIKIDVVAVICNPSSGKIEAGGWQM